MVGLPSTPSFRKGSERLYDVDWSGSQPRRTGRAAPIPLATLSSLARIIRAASTGADHCRTVFYVDGSISLPRSPGEHRLERITAVLTTSTGACHSRAVLLSRREQDLRPLSVHLYKMTPWRRIFLPQTCDDGSVSLPHRDSLVAHQLPPSSSTGACHSRAISPGEGEVGRRKWRPERNMSYVTCMLGEHAGLGGRGVCVRMRAECTH